MKKFICGFLCGAVLCTAIGAFAVNSIYENPYRITVNGTEKQIQGYNIDDYSYFKLRDIADAVGGFNVSFDNDTILLSTKEEEGVNSKPTIMPSDLPVGTIPDPIDIQIPSEYGDYDVCVTNDEFKIPTLNNIYIKKICVTTDDVVDKANELAKEDKYTDGLDGCVRDKTRWNTTGEDWELIFDLSEFSNGDIPLEYYYQHIVPWLRTLK